MRALYSLEEFEIMEIKPRYTVSSKNSFNRVKY